MPDRHRPQPPLGRRRLARIIDDERIDHRHAPNQQRRKTPPRQRHRLSRQPLQRPMRADMQHRVDPHDVPQPQIESDEPMPRRTIRIVIPTLPVRHRSPIRLHRRDRGPYPHEPMRKTAIDDRRVIRGRAPRSRHRRPHRPWQRPEQPPIRRQINRRLRRHIAQRRRRNDQPPPRQYRVQARKSIQPDRVPDPPAPRIIRQHAPQHRRLASG